MTTKIHMLADALGRPLRFIVTAGQVGDIDLPLKFHPAAIRSSAVFYTPHGAVVATGGNAKLPYCVALEPVVAMIPA